MKKAFNVFWIIFVGIWSAISNFLMGVSCCLTIILIPFGIRYFKFIKLVFAPAGKRVVTHFSKRYYVNILWLVFGGGLLNAILFKLYAGLLYLTIIGIPIAKQLNKFGSYFFAPFGAELVRDGEYTYEKNTEYDLRLLRRKIIANPDVIVADGDKKVTAKQYLEKFKERTEAGFKESYKGSVAENINLFRFALVLGVLFIILLVFNNKFPGIRNGVSDWYNIMMGIGSFMAIFTTICLGIVCCKNKSWSIKACFNMDFNSGIPYYSFQKSKILKECCPDKEILLPLIEYYPNEMPMDDKRCMNIFALSDKLQIINAGELAKQADAELVEEKAKKKSPKNDNSNFI